MNWAAIHDSLGDIEPWLRPRWLAARGLSDYYAAHSLKPTADSGLACAGRWSYGPSARISLRVTGTDTVICLTRGSGVSLIRFRSHDSLTLDLLSDIDCSGITSRAILQDTLVFCGMWQGGTGIEVWGASDLRSPHRLSYVYLPPVKDIAVRDTLLYAVSFQGDSLRVFNVADPRNPIQVGACANPGIYMYGIQVSGNYCYMADQNGLFIVDVSTPQSPHIAGTIGGFDAFAVAVRDTLCYLGTQSSTTFALKVYNVKDPATPFSVGSLTGIEAHDLCIPPTCDTIIYTPKLHVINIANPGNPRQIGFVDCPGWDYGVAAVPALNYVLVADYFKGMVAVNVTNPTAPALDIMAFAGDQTVDISIDNGKAYLASYHAGLQILNVADPTKPSYLGCYDTAGASRYVSSAAALDSFAFMTWERPRLLSINVADPTRPVRVAGCDGMANPPEDMVVRDSFVYCAEASRLQIVNIARPREPVLVGTCVTQEDAEGLCLVDSLAYVANYPFAIINVKQPTNPVIISTIQRGAWNGAVRDTFLFLSSGGILVYSVADPGQPRLIDSLSVGPNTYWVEAVGSLLYTGNRDGVRVIDASDVHNMRVRGFCSTPYTVRRLTYASPYIYASCYEAGVCVLESTQVGVNETTAGFRPARALVSVVPSPATDCIALTFDGYLGDRTAIVVRDVTGKEVMRLNRGAASDRSVYLDVTSLASGVYYMDVTGPGRRESAKFVKQ